MPTTPPATETEATSHWSVLVAVCILALAATPLLGGDRLHLTMLCCFLAGAFVLVEHLSSRNALRVRPSTLTSPWTMALAGQAIIAYGALTDPSTIDLAWQVFAAAALFCLGTFSLAWGRLRQVSFELAIEAGISTSGLALLSYCLLLDPWVQDHDGRLSSTVAFAAAALLVAAFVMYGWLVSVDRDAKGTGSGLLIGCGLVVGAGAGIVLHDSLTEPLPSGLRATLAIVGICLSFASAAHPDQRRLRMPAMMVEASKVEHRALMAIVTVLVGPALVAVGLLVDVQISTAVTAMGSGLLSLAVSAHVFRLLRRWGALEHDVHHDSLTGLPNRAYFNNRLELAVELARAERRTAAVMFLDLDRFKNVNDSLGHEAGNVLLVQVARRLSNAVDRSVVVARLGGDEFAILIPAVKNYRHTEAIAKNILKGFEEPFEVSRRKLYMTPSIGVAHYPTDGLLPSELLEHADAAMYRAKERGRNTVELYTAEHRAQAFNKLDLESALHNAVDEGQLRLFYQPKVNLQTGRVSGVESLVRWNHPILGPIPPDEFIPLAEESGLIALIGEWTLIEGCTQARAWLDQGIEGVTVAVNLSPRQFQLQRVQDLVAKVLRLTNLPGEMLELELTESLALQDPDGVRRVIDDLHKMGVKCSIDDFGVGYSGLGYLDQFHFDAIKIDRTFVERIDENGAPIVTAVIAMAKGLQIDVVAEGVETLEQLDFLRRNGCTMMQGYLFSRPLPADELEPILQKVLERPRAELVRNLGALTPGVY